jgi:hypothetical protein
VLLQLDAAALRQPLPGRQLARDETCVTVRKRFSVNVNMAQVNIKTDIWL